MLGKKLLLDRHLSQIHIRQEKYTVCMRMDFCLLQGESDSFKLLIKFISHDIKTVLLSATLYPSDKFPSQTTFLLDSAK